ncbi:PREDICTED: metallophosphoesterase 1-like isoform X3 [Nelumbo nucifera]|uniref:Metallophosphoesterase 1-like isoform X3 n=1 Tax=Nelumbo nucifera TaxID=4432 RepID=A0A1U8ANR9_NELNU|nr:PREDICTED: metallophosphoesterase 1-like isoform X3 [Nelumbo nucifera]
MVVWRSALPLIIAVALMTFEHWVTIPSCEVVSRDNVEDDSTKDSGELKVMMVANLLLLGSEAGYTNIYFRDSFTAKFFRQLQRMLGPFLGLPLHIVLGDRDIGECSKINAKFVNRIASNFPGLDSAGCGSFEVSNISFVSLNAVALLCGDNDLRFGVEKIIEKESVDLQTHTNAATEIANETTNSETNFSNFVWRENTMLSGSGPVLLLHFPLHSTLNSNCAAVNALNQSPSPCHHKSLKTFGNRRLAGAGPYDLLHTVPPNETEYIFQALKPRIIFSAHTHEFYDRTHRDGTREVTVPAMTWDGRDDPGFVVATFGQKRAVTVIRCFLARESHIVMAYVSVLVLLLSVAILPSGSTR